MASQSSPSGLGYSLTPEQMDAIRTMDRASVRNAIVGLPKADLAAWLATAEGAEALNRAFQLMPDYYVGGLLDGERMVRWHVRRGAATPLTFDLLMNPRTCVVRVISEAARPDLTLTLDAVAFVEIASNARSATGLFMQGELQIKGSVRLAMKMEALFSLGSQEQEV